jgi:hypothetical protein
MPFQQLYAKVPDEIKKSLQAFRKMHPHIRLELEGSSWNYIVVGNGDETILFLHGMAGALDIWWQVIARYRCALDFFEPPVSQAAGSPGILLNNPHMLPLALLISAKGHHK